MLCSKCGAESGSETRFCGQCGTEMMQNPYSIPVNSGNPVKAAAVSTNEGDATGGIIPYKNPKALIAYYLGIFSGFPLIGFPLGIAAFILGILGLRDRKRNPVIKGSIHAGIGIGCGLVFTLLWGFVLIALLVSFLSNQ